MSAENAVEARFHEEPYGVLKDIAVVCNRCGDLVADVPTARERHLQDHENTDHHVHDGGT